MIAVQPNGQGDVLSAKSGTTGGIGGPSASPPGGTPKRQRPAGARPATPTFANLQQQGMARPTPDMAYNGGMLNQQAEGNTNIANTTLNQQAEGNTNIANTTLNQQAQPSATTEGATAAAQQQVAQSAPQQSGGSFRYGGNVQQLGGPLMQQVMALLNDPTQGLNEAAQSNFDRQNRVLGREFGELRENLNENMAARGLDASTIAATGLGQLGARQADAQGDLAARVQEKLINDRAAAMNSAINAAMGLRGQEMEMEKDEYVINENTGELEFRRGLDTNRFNLDAELGRGNLALGRDRLGLDRDKFGWEKDIDLRDFDYKVGRDTKNDAFRDNEFDWRKNIDQRDFDYGAGRDIIKDGQWQQGFDRDGVWRDEDNTYRADRDRVRDGQVDRQFDRDNDWRNEDNTYRDGRDKVGDERWETTNTQNQKNFDTGTIMDILRTMGITSLPPGMMDSLMQTLGIGSVSGGNTGYGSPYGGGYSGGGSVVNL
jgi:hypothetical protein